MSPILKIASSPVLHSAGSRQPSITRPANQLAGKRVCGLAATGRVVGWLATRPVRLVGRSVAGSRNNPRALFQPVLVGMSLTMFMGVPIAGTGFIQLKIMTVLLPGRRDRSGPPRHPLVGRPCPDDRQTSINQSTCSTSSVIWLLSDKARNMKTSCQATNDLSTRERATSEFVESQQRGKR